MNTRLKCRNLIFLLSEPPPEKNGLRICPINDDLASVKTWGPPEISRFSRRSHHHDA